MQTDKIQQFFIHYQQVWKVLAVIVAAIPLVVCFIAQPIFCDTAYYLSIGQRLAEGYRLYTDVHSGYPPLWLYLVALLKIVFCLPDGCYWPYLLLYYLFYLATGWVLYRIALLFTQRKSVAFFVAWLFFPFAYWQFAYGVLLEIPSVFFGLLSCYFVLTFQNKSFWNYLWIGAIAAASFLVKQYGAGFLLLDIYLMLFIGDRNWKSIGLLLIGYVLPVILCFAIWQQDFLCLFLNGYGTTSAEEAGRDTSLLSKLGDIFDGWWRFCGDACPAAVVGLLIARNSRQQKRLHYFLFALCGILGFSLQFYFNIERHYRIYLVPFACLLIAEMLVTQTRPWLTTIKYLAIIWTVGASLFNTYRLLDFTHDNCTPAEIRAISARVRQYVPENAVLWPAQGAYYPLTFTTPTLMPNLSTVGYSFGPLGLNPEEAMQQAKSAEWVVYDPDLLHQSFYYLTDSLDAYVRQFPSVPLCETKGVRLYKMEKEAVIAPLDSR